MSFLFALYDVNTCIPLLVGKSSYNGISEKVVFFSLSNPIAINYVNLVRCKCMVDILWPIYVFRFTQF